MRSGFATLVGRPNVGKSTLLNRVLGTKVSIVSDKVQTTRTQVRGVLNRSDVQVVFVDTPGIHKPRTLLGERLNDTATHAIGDVDVVCFVIDATAYCVSMVASRPASASATPTAFDQATSPPRKTEAERLGSRPSRCASPMSREKRSSGVGKGSEGAWNQLHRSLDVAVVDIKMRDRAQPRRMGRHREPDTVLP